MNTKMTCLLLASVALCVGSCSTKNQNSELEIQKLIPPTTSEALDAAGAATSCSYSAATAEYTFQSFNTARDFSVGIVIKNNLTQNGNPSLGRLNTNDFLAMQAITTYESTDGSLVNIPQQVEPIGGVAAAGGTLTTAAILIPAAVAAQLSTVTSVRLHVRIEGRLLDGSTISTNEYLPVAVPTSSSLDSSSCLSSAP